MFDNLGIIFPKQAIPDKQKDKKWYIDNMEAGIALIYNRSDNGLRMSIKEKNDNVNLFHGEVDKVDIDNAVNPYNLSGKFPDTYKSYPVAKGTFDLLFGEERKRIFMPTAYVINSDMINSGQEIISNEFKKKLQELVVDQTKSEDEIKAQMAQFAKWAKYTYQDQNERMANQVTQFTLNATEIKEDWSRNFEDLMLQGEEIMMIDVLGGKLIHERLDPRDVTTFRSMNSYKVEDSDIILISRFMPIGTVIDNYYDLLEKSDGDKLNDIYLMKTTPSKMYPGGQLNTVAWDINKAFEGMNDAYGDNRFYDEYGNVRVIRVLWKSQRRIGFVEYPDGTGNMLKKQVPDGYKPNTELGEKVSWKYIGEWHECTKIGSDIYTKYGPRPIQFRDADNPSLCHPGVVGNILNTSSSRAKSLMSYLKPYILLYNFYMHRLQKDVMKYQGHIARFNLATKPDKWSVEKVMHYMNEFGIYVEDPFNEGQEGAATGKLAGGLGHNPGSMQIGDHNLILMNIQMLEFIEDKIADISGVTPQRMGAISNRETVGGVERSVMQSSNITEKYYALHENFKLRCLRTIIETAKYAWRDKKEKRTYVLDDGTKAVLDFDGDMFNLGSYGLSVSSSSDTTDMMNSLKQLGQAYMQNDGDLVSIMDIHRTKDPATLRRKLEDAQEQKYARQEQSEKRAIESQQQQQEMMIQMEEKRMEHDRLLKELELNNRLQIALISQEGQDNTIEYDKLKVNEDKIKKELALKEKQLSETVRHNKEAERISAIKKKTSK